MRSWREDMRKEYAIWIIFFLVITILANGQLKDSNLVNRYSASAYRTMDQPDSAIFYSDQAIAIAQKIDWIKGIADSYYGRGHAHVNQANYPLAVEDFLRSQILYNELIAAEKNNSLIRSYKNKKAYALCNIGRAYNAMGNYSKAQEYNVEALKIFEEIDSKRGQALGNSNMGLISLGQKDFSKAESYLLKAIRIDSELGDVRGVSRHYIIMGNMNAELGKRSDAIDAYSKVISIGTEIGDSVLVASSLGDIGGVYSDVGDSCLKAGNPAEASKNYEIALNKYQEALTIAQTLNYTEMCVAWQIEMGGCYTKLKRYSDAEKNLLKANQIAESNNLLDMLDECCANLSELYAAMGKYESAYKFMVKHIALRDSAYNKENTRKIIQSQLQYDYDKKQALVKSEQDKKDAVNELEKRRERVITISVSVGLILMLILVIVVLRSLNQNKKKNKIITDQKHEVEKQKELVEEKQKEIIDSINYAKRLQGAILTSEKTIRSVFKESFILFKPKDIVSGDFYWMVHLEDRKINKNIFVFAAADCTGHGVPWAFMSMLNSTLLNQTVYNPNIITPADVLNFMNDELPKNLRPTNDKDNIQDGMDIAFGIIDINKNTLKFCGANNPCWLIRNGQLVVLEPLKQAITASTEYKKLRFVDQEIPLQKGDSIYVFTDGYSDQFGGPKGKKFKEKNLEKLLMSINKESMEKQKMLLEKNLDDWKGDLDQVDDVCIIGIRI